MHSWLVTRPVQLKISASVLMLIALVICTASRPLGQGIQGRTSAGNRSSVGESIETQLRQAAELLQAGKREEAEPIIRQVVKSNPTNSDAHNLLGIILDQRGKTTEAEREYRTAIRLNPKGVSARTNLGVLLVRANRGDEAIKTFESVLQAAPDHIQAALNLGLQYAARGDDARAIPLLQRVNASGLENYDVRYRLGISLFNLKRLDEATTSLESALALSSNAAEPYYYLGLIQWAKGHDDQAADLWDRAVTLRPDFPEANFMLGEALRKNHRTSASVEFYKRALDQDPSKFVYYARLGGVYIALGQPNLAVDVFRSGVQGFPKTAEAHYFLGIASRASADYDNAETELRKSLALQADNVNALAQLGFVLLERDRMTEAEAVLRHAVAINDKHFYANYDLGRLLVKSRRYPQALPILQHAATLKPKNSGVHYQLFMALTRLKRKDEADRELAIFKQLETARKAAPRSETEIEDDDLQNPAAPQAIRRN